ncbi:MAG: glycoside hydrolase family 10 protein [Velocimicrobium sp.]
MELLKKTKFFVGMGLLLLSVFISGSVSFAATKDKTPPKITESLSYEAYTNQSIKITIKVTDASAIKTVKWASGAKKISYFKNSGKELTLDSKNTVTVKIKKNATYTFYAQDKKGNQIKKKVTITNIDKELPKASITLNTEEYTNTEVTVSIAASDDLSGVQFVKYLSGEKTIEDFVNAGDVISLSDNGISQFVVQKNGSYSVYLSDFAGNETVSIVSISNIDKTNPVINPSYSVMNQRATVVLNAMDVDSGIKRARYIKGTYSVDSDVWGEAGNEIPNLSSFQINAAGTYSILVEDNAGNKEVSILEIKMEFRAAWISYLEFLKSKNYSEEAFKTYIDSMFDNCVSMNMNAVVVQVRPFGDAMYQSKYFPWSYYASGTQGDALSYDPLEYMIEAAHKRNLAFHAWINPYRVTLNNTDVETLAADNPARRWRENDDTKRYVLTYGKNMYYNPAITDVQNLIIKGVKEIVKKYDVDGIHFDDYFYPNLGTKYASNFDITEYNAYVNACEASGKTEKTIVEWRRSNVNTLVKRTYKAIKAIDKNCVFGISPAGNISNLLSDNSYYVDIKTWLSSSNYIDYICPQIYWSFEHKSAPYKTVLNKWIALKTSDTVNLYVGLAVYRAGISEKTATKTYGDIEWSQSNTVLKRQVLYGRNTGMVDGYMLFRYDFMIGSTAKKEMKNLVAVLD